MSTDGEWERWARQDPYFSVLTHPRFRSAAMNEQARAEFLASGQGHADYVLGICRQRIDAAFAPQRILDFGCGVGRVLIPFAAMAREAVGVDVSPSMLAEARRNCEAAGLSNVVLLSSDDNLSAVEGRFDLVHSCIVLQHIDPSRGRPLLRRLVQCVGAGGIGALQVTFAWTFHAEHFGRRPPDKIPEPGPIQQLRALVRNRIGLTDDKSAAKSVHVADTSQAPDIDPEMQMNAYDLNELLFILHEEGADRVHAEFTDHAGALGVFLFFRMDRR